ncbi:MAG: hypothetical protein ISR69_04020, partial [Gammaproteobacteria bacterium]|nr:hypothetical protein [Gammaproteobacteria bacterium]
MIGVTLNGFLKLLLLLSFVLMVGCENKGNPLKTTIVDEQGTYGAAISPNGKYLLTGSIDGFGRVWDINKGKVLYSVQHDDNLDGGMIDAQFSADSSILVTMEQGSIARWNVSDGRLTGYWKWPDCRALAISGDGRYALLGLKSKQAVYFDMQTGKMKYVFAHHEKITSVSVSKNGRFALTGADDWHASLWDLTNEGKHIWSKNMQYKVSNVTLSDDGKYAFANAYVRGSKIFSTDKKGKLIAELPEHKMTVVSADFSDKNKIIATGRASKGID